MCCLYGCVYYSLICLFVYFMFQGCPRIKVLEHRQSVLEHIYSVLEHSIPSTTNCSLTFHQLVLLYKPFINNEDPN